MRGGPRHERGPCAEGGPGDRHVLRGRRRRARARHAAQRSDARPRRRVRPHVGGLRRDRLGHRADAVRPVLPGKVGSPERGSREEEEAIESIYFDGRFRVAAWSEVGSIRSDDTANPRYLEAILAKVDVAAIRKSAFTVVVDPGNGAGCVVTPYLLRSLGCRVISLNGQPDGAFPGRMPEPIPAHLGDLMRVVS